MHRFGNHFAAGIRNLYRYKLLERLATV